MASEKSKKFVSDDEVSTAATPVNPEGGAAEIDPKKEKNGEDGKIEKRTNPMKESVLDVFSGVDLSEEAKEKIAAIFEAAVESRANEIAEAKKADEEDKSDKEDKSDEEDEEDEDLKEAIAEQGKALLEATSEKTEELLEGVSRYLNYVAEKFMEENAIGIESSLAVEKATRLMEGLQNIMAEARVEVTEESIDIFAELEEKVEEKDARINALVEENLKLNESISKHDRNMVIAEAARDLSESQAEQLRSVAMKLVYESNEVFTADVLSLKDRMFKNPTKRGADITENHDVIQEDKQEVVVKSAHPDVDAIIAAINSLK